jgi:hypothetical protein
MDNPKPNQTPPPEIFFARTPVICLALVLVTLAVFARLVQCEFINFDDPEYIMDNPHVLGGLSWAGIKWAFSTVYFGNWLPLTWLSLMLDVQMFGHTAAGLHLVNVLIHAVNASFVFVLLMRLTGARWRSALVAALFALHPLHVESVAWVAERRDVLCALFGLLTLIFYARYAGELKVQSPKSKASYWIALFFFACGLMSKAMIVTWPCLMLLLDFWPLKRFTVHDSRFMLWRLAVEKIPFALCSAGVSAITWFAQKKAGAVAQSGALPFGDRLGNALVSYPRYLGKTFWPTNLALPYPHPGHWPLEAVVASLVLLLAISAVATWQLKQRPFLFVGWFWFLGTLVPAIGLIQTGSQSMADRFTYLPLVGVFIIFAWGFGEIFSRARVPRFYCVALATVVLAACIVRTGDQLRYWHDTEALFSHATAVTRKNFVAEQVLGEFYFHHAQADKAVEHYERALAFEPHNALSHFNLGNILRVMGRTNDAGAQYQLALNNNPADIEALNNLGLILIAQGKPGDAIELFAHAVAAHPDDARAHRNLAEAHFQFGALLATGGDLKSAVAQWRLAVQLRGDWVQPLNSLAWVLATANDSRLRNAAEAEKFASAAAELTHQRAAEILDTLAAAQAENGDFAGATATAQHALDIAIAERNEKLAEQIRLHQDNYKTGRPWRE